MSRAEHRSSERTRLAGLFERSEFPRDPFDTATRRVERDTGVFFWFVFFHVEENEQTKKKPYPGSVEPHRGLHQRWCLNQNQTVPGVSPVTESKTQHLSAAIERRIKRHLIGRMQSFFAITAPGLETLGRRELETHLGTITVRGIEKGGVSFEARLHDVYSANLHCRTAHRILMRVHAFRAEAFDTLVHKTAGIPWELYLPRGCRPHLKVSTHRSRLYHSDAVAERIRQAIQTRMDAHSPATSQGEECRREQSIYARVSRNTCLLSIDSSGANLHKRGLKQQRGQAPLRETLAAAVLMRAGYTGQEVLCDPMCGSGTFAIEGALMAKGIPPGWFREFAFLDWPAFKPGRWRHIRRVASPPEMNWPRPRILASDRIAGAVQQLQAALTRHGLTDVVRVEQRAFESLSGPALSPAGGIVVINPPYGKRLGSRRTAEETYDRIGRHLQSNFKGWKAAVLAPSRRLANLLGYKSRRYVLQHGGQRVHLLVGRLPK